MASRFSYPITLKRLNHKNGVGWIATVDDLPGCAAEGDTPEEAAAKVDAAVEDWIRSQERAGRPVPRITGMKSASGELLARMPVSMHLRLRAAAEAEGVSMNTFLVAAIAEKLGMINEAEAV